MSIGKIKRETLENAATMIREKLAGSDEANEGILPSQIAMKIDHVATHNYERGYRNGENAIIPIKRQLEAKVFGEVRDGALADSVGQAVSDFEAIRGEIIAKGVTLGAGRPTEEYADKVGEVYAKGENAGYERGNADGAAEGYENGKAAGREEGYNDGFSTGKSEGYNSGYQIGKVDGKAEGYENGKAAGREEGYNDGFSTGKSEGVVVGREEGYNSGYQIGKVDGKAEVEAIVKPTFFSAVDSLGALIVRPVDENSPLEDVMYEFEDVIVRKEALAEMYVKTSGLTMDDVNNKPYIKIAKSNVAKFYLSTDGPEIRPYLLMLDKGGVELDYYTNGAILEVFDPTGTLTKDDFIDEDISLYVEVYNLYSPKSGESKLHKDENNFVWYVDDDNCFLCDYIGKERSITLPTSYNGREYIFWKKALSGLRVDYIHIPKELKNFSGEPFYSENPFGNDIYIVVDNPSDWCEKNFTTTYSSPMKLGALLTCNGEIVKNIVVPENITTIGVAQFYLCKDIESVVMHDEVNAILGYAFNSCENLKTITIPDRVTTFGNYVFSYSGLENFAFPRNIKDIGAYILAWCQSLKTLTVYGKMLPSNMCYLCKELTDITFNDNITDIKNNPFAYCAKITNVTVNGTIKITNSYLRFSDSPLLTVESMVSIMNALVSNVGGTQYTVYFGTTNLNKLTAEQKAIATNKNIKLA